MNAPRLAVLSLSLVAGAAQADLSSNPRVAAAQAAQRDLWQGHIFWVRTVAVATFDGNAAAATAAEAEVVANAKQIAFSLEPFYGKVASEKLFGLLAGHWGAVKAHLQATVKGDAKAQDAAMKQMLANVDELATFLSGANPNLPKDTLVGLLSAHGGHHATQHAALKAKRYADEARTWEAMGAHMHVIADAVGGAIAKQFPDKFSAM
jgi:hypothetical protein